MSDSQANEAHAQLRELALPWEAAEEVAFHYAAVTVQAMRANLHAFAEQDPYEDYHQNISAPLWAEESSGPAVQAMAEVFIGILNRRGLIKIDPA